MASPPPPRPLPGNPKLIFRQVTAADVPRAAELETASYPADEAATPEKLEYRQRVAPELFYGVYEADRLIAFVVSTSAAGKELEEATRHCTGHGLCIHRGSCSRCAKMWHSPASVVDCPR